VGGIVGDDASRDVKSESVSDIATRGDRVLRFGTELKRLDESSPLCEIAMSLVAQPISRWTVYAADPQSRWR
jgi:hypothetical protein